MVVSSVIAGMVVAIGYYFITPIYHVVHGAGLLERHDLRTYAASNEGNLKALYVATMKYHETEGQFPDAKTWMDQIKTRIRANDMTEAEALKKLINPLYPPAAGVYGYAFNEAVAGKYKKDIKDQKTPLIFNSTDTTYNAHGDPAKLNPKDPAKGGNEAVAVDGSIVKLRP
jgi:hypothetical protein